MLTGGCNEGPPVAPSGEEEYLLLASRIGHNIGAIAVVIYQLPNCHIRFPSDPSGRGRSEDALVAWGWRQYILDPLHDPQWLIHLPMAKAGMQCMKAVEQYTSSSGIANLSGWLVSGASKRGWASWLVGAATCTNCPTVVGLAPLVPIVPSLMTDVHIQFRSYGGFTFAFRDYLDAGLQVHSHPFKR